MKGTVVVIRGRPIATIKMATIAVKTSGTAAIHHRPQRYAAKPKRIANTVAPTARILRRPVTRELESFQ